MKCILFVKGFLRFTRFTVSAAVAFSSWAAAIIFSGEISFSVLPAISGIFLLACGASALNQVQERKHDILMERTCTRPIPAGQLSIRLALVWSFLFISSGLVIIFFTSPINCFLLGIFNILWYNGLYTFLKKKTAFAVVPGSLTGAIPVLMGWSAAGGLLSYPEPWIIAFFIFMWQIPHFWLLILKYGPQYQMAGFPVLTTLFSERQMKNVIFSWLVAASAVSLLMVNYMIWFSPWIRLFIILLNAILLLYAFFILFFEKRSYSRHLFVFLNVFMMLVLLLIVAGRITH